MENSAKKVESVQNTEKANEGLTKPTPADLVQSKANANSTLKKMRLLVSANKLIEAGAHIGLHPRKWNAKMRPFIYAKRSNNHVIDIVKSLSYLNKAYTLLEEVTKAGGRVLIVGTNGELVKDLIQKEARRAKAFCVTQRWLGGTLTNFKNISKSISKLNDNLNLIKSGEIQKYTKKEQIEIKKQTDKAMKFYGGIRMMKKLPQVMIVMDSVLDKNAVIEARKLKIPVIALANTNANPELIDFIIPVNNNSFRTMWLILNILVDAIATANGESAKVVGKADEEIVLPETLRRKKVAQANGTKTTKNEINE